MRLNPVLPPSSWPSFGTLRVTCPSTGTQRWHVGGSGIGSGGMGVCLERYILPWEQVIIKKESRRNESISTPSRRPINTTSAPYKHQGRVARLHRETPQQTVQLTTGQKPGSVIRSMSRCVDCGGFCKSLRKHTFIYQTAKHSQDPGNNPTFNERCNKDHTFVTMKAKLTMESNPHSALNTKCFKWFVRKYKYILEDNAAQVLL